MDELPVRGVDILRARHGSAALRDFYAQHAALFETNVLLVELIGAVETEHRFAGLCKPVYALGEGACIFIDAEDQRHLKSEPESVRRHLAMAYRDAIFQIEARHAPSGTEIVKRPAEEVWQPYEQQPVTKRARLGDDSFERVIRENCEKAVTLALRDPQVAALRREHALELQVMHQQCQLAMQERELALWRQFGIGLGGANTPQLSATPTPRGVRRVSEWLGENRYGQDLSQSPGFASLPTWAFLFGHEPRLTPQIMDAALSVESVGNGRVRLVVPLTYRYSLSRVIALLGARCRDSAWHRCTAACDPRHQIVLYDNVAPVDGDAEARQRAHAHDVLNSDNLAVHLHMMMKAQELTQREQTRGTREWRLCLPESEPRFAPALEIIAEHYPHAALFGPQTPLTHDMGLYLKNTFGGSGSGGKKGKKSGMGTGKNKKCPFCCVLARMTKQGEKAYSRSHQPKKCSMFALISNNEADLLLCLLHTLQASEASDRHGESLLHHEFLFGAATPQKKGDVLDLGRQTLLRHATETELLTGQHINGLRINSELLVALSRTAYAKMRQQFENSLLFGELDTAAAALVEMLTGVTRVQGQIPAVRALVRAGDGLPFLATRFVPQTKQPLRQFVGELYFSLETRPPISPTLGAHGAFVEREHAAQDAFLARYYAERDAD